MEKKRNELKGGTDMLGDKGKRIVKLENIIKENQYELQAHSNAIKTMFSIIEDLKAQIEKNSQMDVLKTEKSDPSAKLRNKDGLLDSRVYFGKKQKEDEE